jgi:hypothetical protein
MIISSEERRNEEKNEEVDCRRRPIDGSDGDGDSDSDARRRTNGLSVSTQSGTDINGHPNRTSQLIGTMVRKRQDDANANTASIEPSAFASSGGGIMPAWVASLLIVSLGLVTSGGFLYMGIRSSYREQYDQFERSADDTVRRFQSAFQTYTRTASLIHNRCRSRNFTREEFRQLYEYVKASGLTFQAIQFDPRIHREERAQAEEEARNFYARHYPNVRYRGFLTVPNDNTNETFEQAESDFYYPIHYMEPVVGNEAAVALDYHSSESRRSAVRHCLSTGEAALTDRLRLIQDKQTIYGVVLFHPGVNVESSSATGASYEPSPPSSPPSASVWPRDLASIVIRIPDLIDRAMESQGGDLAAYLFDPSRYSGDEPLFLGGVRVSSSPSNGSPAQIKRRELTFIPETHLHLVTSRQHHYKMANVSAANKVWTVVVVAVEGTFQPHLIYVVLSSAMILLASLGLAHWNYSYTERVVKFNAIRAAAEAEKQALILENARQAAIAERELNDFIAYVAMSAL